MLSKKRMLLRVVGAIGIVSIGTLAVPSAASAAEASEAQPELTLADPGPWVIGNYGDSVNAEGCLDVYDWGRGPWLQMWECHYELNQFFWFAAGTAPGYYYIQNLQSRQCIDGAWGKGAQLRQLPCDLTDTQEWEIYPTDYNQFVIRNRHNGLCMDMRDSGRSREVQLWTCYWVSHQRWYLR